MDNIITPQNILSQAINSLEIHCGKIISEMAKPKREIRRTWCLFPLWWPAEQYIKACIKYINTIRREDLALYRNLLKRPDLRVRDLDYSGWVIFLSDGDYADKLRIKIFFSLIGADFEYQPLQIEEHDHFRLDGNSVKKVLGPRRKDWCLNSRDALLKTLDWDDEIC